MRQRMRLELAIACCLVIIASSTSVAAAEEASQAAAPAGATAPARDAAALAEEIAVLRAVKPLRATSDQLAALTAAVTQAHGRLAQQAQADTRALAALRDPTARARQQLLPEGVDLTDPQLTSALTADQQVTNAQRAAEQNQARLRDELAAGLRQQFQTLLTPTQAAAIVTQGRAMLAAEQAEQEKQRQQRMQQWQQAAAARGAGGGPPGGGPGAGPWDRGGGGGPGGPGGRDGRGGPGGRGGPQGMMDRIRSMDTAQYQQMTQGLARRFGDPGTPAYQNAMAMMDQIRNMPESQYQQQRGGLMQQFAAGMAASQSAANPAATISADHALDAWIQRYLLSPQGPTALADLAASARKP